MVKKKISISKEQQSELKGFEEVLDLVTGEDTVLVKQKRNQVEDYEIYNFLEKEIKRLEKIDTFFREQVPILENKSAVDGMLDYERVSLDETKLEFIHLMKDKDSQFLANMDRLFASIFTL